MNDYKIKQCINTTSIPPSVYNEAEDNVHSCICIAEKNGKCGMVNNAGEIFLPFEYDNITMAGFDLYLLVQGGKMGLLHVKPSAEDSEKPFEILKQIPCVYDYITCPRHGQSFVYLRKDREKGSELYIYLVRNRTTKGPYWKLDYIDADYVIVTEQDYKTKICFHNNGEFIFMSHSDSDILIQVYGAFETRKGTVFVQINPDDTVELIFVERQRKECFKYCEDENNHYYELTGTVQRYTYDGFVRPIVYHEHLRTLERDYVTGFIVRKNGLEVILGDNCKNIFTEKFKATNLMMYLKGYTDKDHLTYIGLETGEIELRI